MANKRNDRKAQRRAEAIARQEKYEAEFGNRDGIWMPAFGRKVREGEFSMNDGLNWMGYAQSGRNLLVLNQRLAGVFFGKYKCDYDKCTGHYDLDEHCFPVEEIPIYKGYYYY